MHYPREIEGVSSSRERWLGWIGLAAVLCNRDADTRGSYLSQADKNPLCLEEPQPLFVFLGYADSALSFQFSVWATRETVLDLRNSMYLEIKAAFDQADIEIPFPQRSLHAGSGTEPFPVQVVPPHPLTGPAEQEVGQ